MPTPAEIEAARANAQAYQVALAARPHCVVNRSLLAKALKSLATIFEHRDSGNSVVVAFDGGLLTFDCHGLKTVVAATGTTWPARYQLPMAALADVLPIRLSRPKVEVGIWESMLEIDEARCPGVRKVE